MKNFYQKNIPKEIRISLLVSFILILFRIILSDSIDFAYLIWNIFLALIPFIISSVFLVFKDKIKDTRYLFLFILGSIIWLIFFPNTFYLVTDLIHLGEGGFVPIWYDGLMLLSIAWLGIILGFYSLFQIEELFLNKFNTIISRITTTCLIFLTSFGVYLGRFIRLNSWDLFLESKESLDNIWNIFKNKNNLKEAFIFTFIFFIFFTTTFFFWKYINKSKIRKSVLN